MRKYLKIGILSLVLLLGVSFVAIDDKHFEIAKNLDIYHTLFKELNLYYVDETDPGKLIKTSIDEMLTSLDPYTVYIPESQIEDFRFMTTGQYGGIGALIQKRDNHIIISEPYEGFPAAKAGLKAGDRLMEIDGKEVADKESDQISELLKGEPGTQIKLTIHRPGDEKSFEKLITREKISISSVPYSGMLTDDIGYIRLSSFTQDCSKEVKEAFKKLKERHNLKGLVFDLRGNPGGLLDEAVKVSNIFIAKGQEVVSTKGKIKQWNRAYYATDDPMDTQIPLVVLVNTGSASASEIVSGAVQDLDRGIIMGTRTFGKGLVQTTRDLSYNSKLKLTTAKYYIPSGRCIQALDYTNRNEDGSVGRIPDSLITEFKTRVGRKVYDGGGVMPDVKIEQGNLSQIAISLYTKYHFFDFATQYAQKHPSIPAVNDFKITDELYNEFTAYLSDKEYDYTLESEKVLKKLEETIKKDKYDDRMADDIASLKEKMKHDKNKDLLTFREEISELLKDELVGRYYYQTGRAQAALERDPETARAIEILNNPQQYHDLLRVQEQTPE